MIAVHLLKELPRGDTLSRPQSYFRRTIVEATKLPDLVPHASGTNPDNGFKQMLRQIGIVCLFWVGAQVCPRKQYFRSTELVHRVSNVGMAEPKMERRQISRFQVVSPARRGAWRFTQKTRANPSRISNRVGTQPGTTACKRDSFLYKVLIPPLRNSQIQ